VLANPPGFGRLKVLAIQALLAGAFVLSTFANYRQVIVTAQQYDDSYITYRYAVNLAEGRGLVFNTYEKLNSASSLLYTLVLAAIYAIGIHDLPRVAIWIGLASGVASLVVGAKWAVSESGMIWPTLIILLPFSVSGTMSAWAVSGMETTFFTALVVAFLYTYTQDQVRLSLLLLCACLLARPEAILLLFALSGSEIVRSNFRIDNRVVLLLGSGIATLIGYFVFNVAYYGSLLPHSVLLKSLAFNYSPSIRHAAKTVLVFFVGSFATVSILGAAQIGSTYLRFLERAAKYMKGSFISQRPESTAGNRDQHAALPEGPAKPIYHLLAIYVPLSLISFVVGPASDFGRYMTHLVPVLAFAAIALLSDLFEGIPSVPTVRGRVAIGSLACLLLLQGGLQAEANQADLAGFFSRTLEHQKARQELGDWIEANVPKGQLVLSSDVGEIAYIAKTHDFIDAFGLTTNLPVVAVRRGDWALFTDQLVREAPMWLADTSIPGGKVQAFEIIGYPQRYFRGLPSRDMPYLDMYSPNNSILIDHPTPDGYAFRVIRIDPAVYAR
jgi:hypothetical protein